MLNPKNEIGWSLDKFLYFDVLDSTQAEAKRTLKSGILNCAILANHQTEGRGRYKKTWISASSNLQMSILLTDPIYHTLNNIRPLDMQQIPIVTILGVYNAIQNSIFEKKDCIKLKWPNDIYLNDAKIGGVLIEIINDSIIIGIGINTFCAPKIIGRKTDCLSKNNLAYDKETFFQKITLEVIEIINKWIHEGFDEISNEWMNNSYYSLDDDITIEFDEKIIRGKFKGINRSGLLVIMAEDSNIYEFSDGEHYKMQNLS